MRLILWMCLVVFAFVSCAQREAKDTVANEQFQLEVRAQYHTPYCGGAYPSPEQEKGFVQPLQNEVFYVKKGSSNSEEEPVILSFVTDEEGKALIHLPIGEYCIIRKDQSNPFATFYAPYRSKENTATIRYLKEDCFREWYAKPEVTFIVTKNETIHFVRQTTCFTASNPCAIYTGPLPP